MDGVDARAAVNDLLAAGFSRLEVSDRDALCRDDAYRAAEVFFDEPLDTRLASRLPFGCGYMPFGTEHSGDADRHDQVEGFVASVRTEATARALPPKAAALHAALLAVFDTLEPAAEDILIEVAARCGVNDSTSLNGGLRRWSLLQIHRARRIEADAMINTPHEDGHFLTFAHATAAGLEIEIGGAFQPVDRRRGSLTLISGSALTLMSGGMIKPLRHLVRSHAVPRMSMMFFADLDPALCTAWAATPSNYGVDIGAHVLGNSRRFGVEGFTPD